MKPNFGLLPPLDQPIRGKRAKHGQLAERSLGDLEAFMREKGLAG